MMSVTTDAAGWTVVGASADTRVVYVSSSGGSDTNNGLSADQPVATIAKAKTLVRSGMPDHMLLKRGDVWNESFGYWSKSGRSASEPIYLGTYGSADARPTLRTGISTGMDVNGAIVNHFIMKGIAFHAHTRDPGFTSAYVNNTNTGLRFVGSSSGAIIEDCSFDSYATNVSIDDWNGTLNNFRFRRNVVTDAWALDKSQGLYAEGVNGLTLEGNVFDHNGWNESAVGGEADIYSHNVYLNTLNNNVVVKGNVISNAASHGLQARAGGQITGNLFLKNPIHMSFGHVNGSPAKAGGVFGTIDGNVFLESRDINGAKRGWAIEIGNTRAGSGTTIRNNIIANDTQSTSAAIRFETGTGVTNAAEHVGVNDVTIENNVIYRWFRAVGTSSALVNGGTGQYGYNDVVVRNNDFQLALDSKVVSHAHAFSSAASQWSGNRYYDDSASTGWFLLQNVTTSLDAWRSKAEATAVSQRVAYADPSRTVATYMASLDGTASLSAFTGEARTQSSTSWDSSLTAAQVIAYIRAGFVDTSTVPAPGPAPDTAAPTATFSATPITAGGGTSHTFAVTYADDYGLDASSIDGNDVKVTFNGTTYAASLVSVSSTTNGTPRTATYRVNAPGGTWDSADNGTYTVALQGSQVADTAGNFAAAKTLGTFTVSVPAPAPEPEPEPTPTPSDTTPPKVVSASFDRNGTRLTIQFSENVSSSLSVNDIVLVNRNTGAAVSPTAMALAYNATTHTAVVTFPGLSGGELSRARYSLTLTATGITDAAGNRLDGNGDGIAGGDYHMNFRQR